MTNATLEIPSCDATDEQYIAPTIPIPKGRAAIEARRPGDCSGHADTRRHGHTQAVRWMGKSVAEYEACRSDALILQPTPATHGTQNILLNFFWGEPRRERILDPASACSSRTDVILRFGLSQNEEHARLVLDTGRGPIDLGERVHHYALATLARIRLQDAQRGLDASSQGWVVASEFARMLGVDVQQVNLQVFRARQQVEQALRSMGFAPRLVERRRGELRLGDYGFAVRRGAVNEGEFKPVQ